LLTHQLERHLRVLRLGGMLDTLDLRLKEAQRDEVGYLGSLETLLEDEINRRSQKALTRRLAQAQFEEVKTDLGISLPRQDFPTSSRHWPNLYRARSSNATPIANVATSERAAAVSSSGMKRPRSVLPNTLRCQRFPMRALRRL